MERISPLNEMEEVYTSFFGRIDSIVKDYLLSHCGNDFHKQVGEKIINDPIWGSVKFNSWEIKIIDTPLFQRLRDIYQVGLGVFTYPSARHSRFEHSLGVVVVADKMIESLKNQNLTSVQISDIDVSEVRLAALLHDIGHCFYSHLSENFYKSMQEFIRLTEYFTAKFNTTPKPHEIFSYIIINTHAFLDFLEKNDVLPRELIDASNDLPTLMKRIGNMIIGVSNRGREKDQDPSKLYSFLTKIINGDIDADKLDYIRRDSYSSGLTLTFNLERLLYKMTVIEEKSLGEYELVMDISGIAEIEEITFNKLMLNNYIYYHHKVLASETMAKDISLALCTLGRITHPCDFLKFTDKSVESLDNDAAVPFKKYGCGYDLGYFVRRVRDRYLPKKCFEINSRVLKNNTDKCEKQLLEREYIEKCIRRLETVSDKEEKIAILTALSSDLFELKTADDSQIAKYRKFIDDFDKNSYQGYTEQMRNDVYEKICELYEKLELPYPKAGISLFDVHIVIPKSIDEKLTFETPLVYGNSGKHMPADMMANTRSWAQTFNSNKWSSFVFISPHIDVSVAFKAALFVFKDYMPDIMLYNPERFVKRLDEEILCRIDTVSGLKC